MTLHVLFNTLYWLWIVSEVATLIITRTRRSTGETRDRGSLLILWPVIFCSIWACMQYGYTHPHTIFGGAYWVFELSLGIFIVGLAMRWTSILSLGRAFSVNVAIHATQTVKTDGLYRYVRHPSYTAMLIAFFGVGLSTRNWIALLFMMVPTTLALAYRIHVEEIALTDGFGSAYTDYARRTKRLIPGIF